MHPELLRAGIAETGTGSKFQILIPLKKTDFCNGDLVDFYQFFELCLSEYSEQFCQAENASKNDQ
jgi:hypothetical protein